MTSTWPIRMVFDVSPFATLIFFTVVPNRAAIAAQRVAGLDLVGRRGGGVGLDGGPRDVAARGAGSCRVAATTTARGRRRGWRGAAGCARAHRRPRSTARAGRWSACGSDGASARGRWRRTRAGLRRTRARLRRRPRDDEHQEGQDHQANEECLAAALARRAPERRRDVRAPARGPARVDRVSGQRPLTGRPARPRRDRPRAPAPRRTWRRSRVSSVRQRSRCLAIAGAAWGCVAPHRWSRVGCEPPPGAVRGDADTGRPGTPRPPTRHAHRAEPARPRSRARCGLSSVSVIASRIPPRPAMRPEAPAGRRTRFDPRPRDRRSLNATIPATTYFPERLPSQYLRRWRA